MIDKNIYFQLEYEIYFFFEYCASITQQLVFEVCCAIYSCITSTIKSDNLKGARSRQSGTML